MKQMMMVFAMIGISCCGAQAQKMPACGVKSDKVCRLTANKKVSCYKTPYAENFAVCKGNSGYFICCEKPTPYNSTHSDYVVIENKPRQYYGYEDDNQYIVAEPRTDMSAPQSQSYVVSSSNSYAGNYPVRGQIRVCNTSDNVAEENRAPYDGCPSPASDGPDANRRRNVNVSNPEPMPPSAGQRY